MGRPVLFCGVPIADLNLTAKERTIVNYLISKSVLSARDLATRGERVLFGTWWRRFDKKALESLGAKLWAHQVRFPRYVPPVQPRVIYLRARVTTTYVPPVVQTKPSRWRARIINAVKKLTE